MQSFTYIVAQTSICMQKASKYTKVLAYMERAAPATVFSDTYRSWVVRLCEHTQVHMCSLMPLRRKPQITAASLTQPLSVVHTSKSHKVILLFQIYINKQPYHIISPTAVNLSIHLLSLLCSVTKPRQKQNNFTQPRHHHDPLTTSRTAQTSLEKSKNHYLTRQ